MIIKLKNIGTIITGNTPSKKNTKYYDSNDIYFIKPDTLDDSKITVLNSSNEFISNNARDKARIVGKNAILITCIGSIGKVGIVTEGEYAFNQQINAIIPNELVIPKYLAYCLLFNKDKLIDIANAPVVPIINKSQFGEFEIIINEDLSVQQKIVNELNIIQEIILKQRQELEKMDDLIKARFVEMFGDPVYNPKGWEIVTIREVTDDVRYGTSAPSTEEGKFPYLRMNNITNDGHLDLTDLKYIDISNDEIDKYAVKKGDVLFNRTNSIELIGKTTAFNLDETMIIAGYIIRLRMNKKMLPEVLSQYMNLEVVKKKLRSMAKGAVNQANINAQELQNIRIYLPPIELQQQFADFVKQVDKSKFIQMNSTI